MNNGGALMGQHKICNVQIEWMGEEPIKAVHERASFCWNGIGFCDKKWGSRLHYLIGIFGKRMDIMLL